MMDDEDEDTERAENAARALANRLTAASHERQQRADQLVKALLARARPRVAPVLPPAEPEPGLLARLRGIVAESLYTEADARDGEHWLGSDPFRLRELPPPPRFLADLDTKTLAPEHVASLLRQLSLADPAPRAIELESAAVSRSEDTGFEIPRVLHSIWLGGVPSAESPELRNLGYAADRYAGECDIVLWTDLPRDAVPDHLVDWAAEHGVALVNIFELFHADAPMITHAQYVLEMAKQLPRGYAAASDLARLEIVYRFGGVYADGDLEYADQDRDPDPDLLGPRPETLVEFLDRLAASRPGFTMDPIPRGGIANDIVAAPARHRVLRVWLEETRVNYFRSHAQIFGGLQAMAMPYVGEDRFALRYVAPHRTGRIHHRVLGLLNITAEDLPATQPPFRFNSVGSWIPVPEPKPSARGAGVGVGDSQVLAVLERCLTVLEWQSIAREGDLYLATIDPVVRALPDPGAAWIALLSVLPKLPGTARITSVTDVRRRDDRGLERIELPPEAQALIDRYALNNSGSTDSASDATAPEAPTEWLGAALSPDGGPVWLVDERVETAALRDRAEACDLLGMFACLTEVAYDAASDEPIGLWIRPDDEVEAWRHPLRFAHLPAGWFGVSLGGPPGWDWREHWPLEAETIGRLVLAAGAAGRPVVLSSPWGGKNAASRLAARLGTLLDQPVEFAEGPLRQPNLLLRPTANTPESHLRYRPLARPDLT